MAKRVGAVEVRNKLGELLARVQYAGERFIITKDGKDVAALLHVEELQRLEQLEDLLDVLAVKLLKARKGAKPLPVEALLEQYERLFGKKAQLEVASRRRAASCGSSGHHSPCRMRGIFPSQSIKSR